MEPHSKSVSYYSYERTEVLPFVPASCKRLLDVGCGAGEFGASIKRRLNCEVWGVEPLISAAEQASQKLDRVLNAAFTEELQLPENDFDVITFNDSLEHFPYPEPPLEYCRRLLTEDGIIVCLIPNVRYLENLKHLLIDADWKYEDEGILDYTHLRFFTKKSICRTFTSCGYEVANITGINPHYWSGWKIRLLQAVFGTRIEDMKWLQFVVVAKLSG